MFKLLIVNRLSLIVLFALLITCLLSLISLALAQSASPASKATATQKRIWALEEYLENSTKFNVLTGDKQKRAYAIYLSYINKAVKDSNECYTDKESQTQEQRDNCSRGVKEFYKHAKQYNRLLKYYLIEQKTPFICVKADLGIGDHLEARGIAKPALYATASGNLKESGLTKPSQVFLCTGEAGQRKLRVQAANSRYVKLTPEDLARADLQLTNLPPAGNLKRLEEKLGIN